MHSHSAHNHHPHSHELNEDNDSDPIEVEVEQTEEEFQRKVSATFDLYLVRSTASNSKRKADFYNLSKAHRDLLPDYIQLINSVDEKLRINNKLIERMIQENPFGSSNEEAGLTATAPSEKDHELLRSTLRQCVRDWSSAGELERSSTYSPILNALDDHFKDISIDERSLVNVLAPGAGLGRLPWEIVRAGYSCQGNEFSLYMLIASSFILNHTTQINEFTIYPFIHSFSNIRSKSDLLIPYSIPDVLPSGISESRGEMSFASGDFLLIYSSPSSKGSYDAITTCFFIDTARNIIDYLEKIWWLLADDGIWINNGPSLWHFEGNSSASSIDLTIEGIKDLSRRIGFIIEEEKEFQTTYTTNPVGMLKSQYTSSFWIGKKGN